MSPSVAHHTTKKMQTRLGSPLRVRQLAFSIWLSHTSGMTLEDAAKLLETFASEQQLLHDTAQSSVMANVNYQSEGVLSSMIFRGEKIQRSQMADCSAKDYMREGEPFNVVFTQTYMVNPMTMICPCCAVAIDHPKQLC